MTYQSWLDDLTDQQWHDHCAGRLEYHSAKPRHAPTRFLSLTGWVIVTALAFWTAIILICLTY